MDRLVMRDACTSSQQLTKTSPRVFGEQAACAVFNSDKGPKKLAVSSMQMVRKCGKVCRQSQEVCTWCCVSGLANP